MALKRPCPEDYIPLCEKSDLQKDRPDQRYDAYLRNFHLAASGAKQSPLKAYIPGVKRVCRSPVGLDSGMPVNGGARNSCAVEVDEVGAFLDTVDLGGERGGSATGPVRAVEDKVEESSDDDSDYVDDEEEEEEEENDEDDEDEESESEADDGGVQLDYGDPMIWEPTYAKMFVVPEADNGQTFRPISGTPNPPTTEPLSPDSPLSTLASRTPEPGLPLDGGYSPPPAIPPPTQAAGSQFKQPSVPPHHPQPVSHIASGLPPTQPAPGPSYQPPGATYHPHPIPPAPHLGPGLPRPHASMPGPPYQPPGFFAPTPSGSYYPQAYSHPIPGYQPGHNPGHPQPNAYANMPPPHHPVHPSPSPHGAGTPNPYPSAYPSPPQHTGPTPPPPPGPHSIPGATGTFTGILEEFLRFSTHRSTAGPGGAGLGIAHNSAVIINILQSIDWHLFELVQIGRLGPGMSGYVGR